MTNLSQSFNDSLTYLTNWASRVRNICYSLLNPTFKLKVFCDLPLLTLPDIKDMYLVYRFT